MKVAILGSGAYGGALATCFLENDVDLVMWSRFDSDIEKLGDIYEGVNFTTDLKEAIRDKDLVVIAIPVAYLESVVSDMKDFYSNQDILIASKGIDTNSLFFSYEIVKKYLKVSNLGVISGGTFAVDMRKKKIMGISLATDSDIIKNKVRDSLGCSFLKVQYLSDYIGVSICGAIKNVMAIGFGMLDGASYPESSRFLFLTEAIYEIEFLIRSLGGDSETIMSYAGIDDIMMTCTSSKSRNYTYGAMIGKGDAIEEICEYRNNTTVEGFGTSLAIYELCLKKGINLPISFAIYKILYENASLELLLNCLKKGMKK